MTIYDKLNKWAEERLLDQVLFDRVGYTQNIIEELAEMWGFTKEKQREVAKSLTNFLQTEASNSTTEAVSEDDVTDAICDISVFSATANRQRNIDMNKAMEETFKEIDSRKGEYVESEKKWCKFTDKKHTALWYKADYKGCYLK